MQLSVPSDHFLKIGICRNNDPVFSNSPDQDFIIAHSWVGLTDFHHIMPLINQATTYRSARVNI